MKIPCILRGVMLCSLSAVYAATPQQEETVFRLQPLLEEVAASAHKREQKKSEESKLGWRHLLIGALALCAGACWWSARQKGKAASVPPSVAAALQSAPDLAAWFEAGVRTQAVAPTTLPLVSLDFFHGVDRCATAPTVSLPPLQRRREGVPIHFHNAVIARFAQQKDDDTLPIPAEESLLIEREGTRADQCSIWRFCELVSASLPTPAEQERAGFACADALLQLVAHLRHNNNSAAARQEIRTWLRQQYPQRVRGYSEQRRTEILGRLAKEQA